MNDTFAIVFAGHGNPFLGDLIAHRAVSALPLAGRFRTIDVLLSNISQSGIRNVGIIMQRNFQSLVEHIGSGEAWDLNSKRGGVALLTPFDQGLGTGLYQNFGDALFAKRYYIDNQRAKYCLLLASDMVYREDYNRMLDYHLETGADITGFSIYRTVPCAHGPYHIFEHLSTDNFVRFLFWKNGVDSLVK